jgi:protein-disulfide isomerase
MKKFIPIILVPFFSVFFLTSCNQGSSTAANAKKNDSLNYIYKAPTKASVVMKILGQEVTEGEVFQGIEGDIYDAESKVYELKMGKLKAFMLEKFIMNHPEKKSLTNDQFLDQIIIGKSADSMTITDKEVQAFIEERKIPAEHINDDLKGRIREFLTQENKKKFVDTWLNEQMKQNPVEVYLPKPQRPKFDVKIGDAPFMGKADAKVTLVEYSDFQCPFCSKAADVIKDIKKKYGDQIKIVFKNYPLPFHQNAKLAAEAGACAATQSHEKFWALHDLMFKEQDKLAESDLIEKGKKLKLDIEKFTKCLKDHEKLAQVENEMKEGADLGVKATPTFFINGKLLSGAQPLEVFIEEIDLELAQ